ncbi:MAG: alternative ribosome rescue aminoacyl-tRNA hydrolase ArfB [Pseudomonadota bacterium]
MSKERPYVDALPSEALSERFVRSRGPGGQNVNKVATGVQLRLSLDAAALVATARAQLLHHASHLASGDDAITIFADRFRSQRRNREDALDRLEALLAQAHRQRKARVATRPSRASVERRRQNKAQRGRVKQNRRPPPVD